MTTKSEHSFAWTFLVHLAMSFLKAEWRKLALANYEVPPKVLEPYCPYGTQLDLWEGKCYVSLVGFMFLNTQLMGIKIPFHVNFEEVNLRFYVKREVGGEVRRGVVFMKEIVPKPAITFVANTLYKENYATMSMKHEWVEKENERSVSYQWKNKGLWQSFSVVAEATASEIAQGSETEFITEHYWGYAHVNNSKTNEYEVTHPRWKKYVVNQYEIEVDFARNYGDNFGFLNDVKPTSVMLAEGSEITVEPKSSL